MKSPVDVVNIALARLSESPIVSLDENTDRANKIRPIWAISLHLFLTESEWSFARVRTSPARLNIPAGAARPFRYAYALPEDCIKVVAVFGSATWWTRRHYRPDYRVALYDGGNRQSITTSADGVEVEYISNRVNISNFPPDAIDAVACRVAAEFALSLDGSSQRGNQLMQFYDTAVAKAKKNDVKKEPPGCLDDEYSRVRLP